MAATFVQTVAEIAGNKNSAAFYSRHKKSSARDFVNCEFRGCAECFGKPGA
jgi:hypothetical protein